MANGRHRAAIAKVTGNKSQGLQVALQYLGGALRAILMTDAVKTIAT
jgi:hypothetical protein